MAYALSWISVPGEDLGGWRLASEGDPVWHQPGGPFTYGQFRLTQYEAG